MIMDPIHIHSPLIYSHPLSERMGKKVYLKLDALQPSGSFKIRGIGHACQKAISAGHKKFISSSAGNAGLATAFAGNVLNIETIVCLPETSTLETREKLENLGATPIVVGKNWPEAHQHAKKLSEEGGLLVHPFNMEDAWEGHSSLVKEIEEDMHPQIPSVIVTSVGGGGLLMGILLGLKKLKWEVPVVACETYGANALAQSLAKGKNVQLDSIDSICKSLGADQTGPKIFEECMSMDQSMLKSVVVTDAEAVASCLKFAKDHGILVEPACAASLATLYFDQGNLYDSYENIVVEVCGGSSYNSIDTLMGYAKTLGMDMDGNLL